MEVSCNTVAGHRGRRAARPAGTLLNRTGFAGRLTPLGGGGNAAWEVLS